MKNKVVKENDKRETLCSDSAGSVGGGIFERNTGGSVPGGDGLDAVT